jgi:predicted Zn-dependent protease
MTETRRQDIQRRAAELTPAARPRVAGDAASLFARLDGLWWGQNPEAGVFHENRFLQPVIGFTITIPRGWKHQNTPQQVIAAHPQQEAALLLGIAGPAADPEATGARLIADMRSKARIEPVSTRKLTIGEFPGFVATYLDRSGREPVYLHYAWVTMGSWTYQLIGLGPEKHREALRDAALTLRPLTDVERASVTGQRLRVVAARRDERLADLSARTGNLWTPAYTALVNGLEVDAPLEEGRLVKIVRQERVRP